MDIHRYLSLLGFKELPGIDRDGLAQLQKAHLLTVPFENLSIHYGQPVNLSIEQLYEKVVVYGRGGFCYELNFLYHALLIKLGFHADLISGRVYSTKKENYGPEFDHMSVLVHLPEGSYISDVGFGEFPFDPVPFELDKVHNLARGQFRIDSHDQTYYRLSKIREEADEPQYLFRDQPCRITDFAGMCRYHQTSPESSFTQKPFISMPTATGRLTVSGNQVRTSYGDGTVSEEPLTKSFEETVRHHFGIVLPTQHP